jgi:2'-5' RNA ligase
MAKKLTFIEAIKKGASDFSQKKNYLPTTQILYPGGSTGQISQSQSTYWFSPLQPIRPIAPSDQRPRQRAIMPGENISWTPGADKEIGFDVLRAFADSWDILRLVIETRKDQLCALEWEIRVKPMPNEKHADRRQRQLEDPTAAKLKEFFEYPDGQNNWKAWLRMLVEDMQVLDAMAVYMERDTAGKIASLHPLDGATINRMMTDQGLTPTDPDSVAYQQVLYGTPSFNFTIDDLYYSMRNPRTHRRYGLSRVEQIMITVAIGIRSQEFLLKYYTDGNMPEAMCFLPADMDIDQVKEIQGWFDSMFAGDLSKRRRLTFLPGYGGSGKGGDAKPSVIFPKETLLQNPVVDFLIDVVCYNFGVSNQGFKKMMNRATAEQAAQNAEAEGLKPDADHLKLMMNDIIGCIGYDDKYEFAWLERRDVDPKVQAEVDSLLAGKIYTINEIRERRGEDRVEVAEADMLGIFGLTGFIPLEADKQLERQTKLQPPEPTAADGTEGAPPDKKGKKDLELVSPGAKKLLRAAPHGPLQHASMGFSAGVAAVPPLIQVHGDPQPSVSIAGEKKKLRKYQYGTTQVDLPSEIAAKLTALARSFDPEHLGDVKGIESRPHITVRYGLTSDDHEELTQALSKVPAFEVMLGKTFSFPATINSDGFAPIVVKVFGAELYDLNVVIEDSVECKTSDFDYLPHATVAYVLPWHAESYVGRTELEGESFIVDRVQIIDKDGAEIEVKLNQIDKRAQPKPKHKLHIAAGDLNPQSEKARGRLEGTLRSSFSKMRAALVKELGKSLASRLRKIDDEGQIVEQLLEKLEEFFTELPDLTEPEIREAIFAGVEEGVLQLGIDDSDLLAEINTVARDWSEDRAAEMVGRKWSEDGTLVDNPDARWAISETTRDEIRDIVARAFEAKEISISDIATSVEEAGIFSESRAEMIARTEVSRAQVAGNLQTWEKSGMVQSLRWKTSASEGVCADCEMNDDEVVQFGEAFPSGAEQPGDDHPNCRCSVIAEDIVEA